MTFSPNLHHIVARDAAAMTPKLARATLINLGNILKAAPRFPTMVSAAEYFADDERAVYIAGVLFSCDRSAHRHVPDQASYDPAPGSTTLATSTIVRDAALGLFLPTSHTAAGLAITAASIYPNAIDNATVANLLCAHTLAYDHTNADNMRAMSDYVSIATSTNIHHDLSTKFLYHLESDTWDDLRVSIETAADAANKAIYHGMV